MVVALPLQVMEGWQKLSHLRDQSFSILAGNWGA